MKGIDKAIALALKSHNGQVNKHDGEPYILHVHRVAIAVREAQLDFWEYEAVAWLHDTLEDTDLTFTEIQKECGDDVANAVQLITKIKGQTNEAYYNAVSTDIFARFVKIHDIHDNFGRNHLITDADTRLRMASKYSLGISILAKR